MIENSGLIFGTRAITALLSLVTIPIVVSRLGMATYGTWEALLAVATLTSIFQGAISGTLVWLIADAFGKGRFDEIRRLVGVGIAMTCGVFLVLWPMAWCLRRQIVQFLRVAPEARDLAAAVFPLAAGLILFGGLAESLEAAISGCQRTGLVSVISAGGLAVNYTVAILLTALGEGLWGLVSGLAAGSIVRLLGAAVAARTACGVISLVPRFPRRSDLGACRYTGLLAAGSVAGTLRDQTDKIVLASLASPSWVGYYGIAARLANLVLETVRFFYLPMLTAVAALNARNDWNEVRQMYSRVMLVVSVVTGSVVVVVGGLAGHVVVLWIGQPLPQAYPLLWVLMAGSAAAAMLTGPGTALCRGVGRVEIETTYLLLNLLLNAALTVILVLTIGAVGTAIATGISWAFSAVVFAFILHERMQLPAAPTKRAGTIALISIGIALCAHEASVIIGMPTSRREALHSLAFIGPASAAAYLACLLALRLVPVASIAGRLRQVLKRRS